PLPAAAARARAAFRARESGAARRPRRAVRAREWPDRPSRRGAARARAPRTGHDRARAGRRAREHRDDDRRVRLHAARGSVALPAARARRVTEDRMPAEKTPLVFVGLGPIGRSALAHALLRHDLDVVAACDPDRKLAGRPLAELVAGAP